MINSTTFTIQSVHGLKETFVVSPNGTVDTTQTYTNREGADGESKSPERQERKSAK